MKTTTTTDTATYKFTTSDAAWAFMRVLDDAGVSAGFPGLRDFTVQVLVRTWIDREAADVFARVIEPGASVIDYQFGSK
jgi:hypothetical protein